MPSHDWEALHKELDAATRTWGREELVVLLRDLIREYVIERGLPTGTPAQATGPDLAAMDFVALVTHLKRTCNLPELALFSVDGRRVIVDLDGPREIRAAARSVPSAATPVGQPLHPPRNVPPPAPAAAPAPGADAAADAAAEPPKTGEKPPVSKRFKHLEFD
jgi:hypothetical protein